MLPIVSSTRVHISTGYQAFHCVIMDTGWTQMSDFQTLQGYPETIDFEYPQLNEITMGIPTVGLVIVSSLPGFGKTRGDIKKMSIVF